MPMDQSFFGGRFLGGDLPRRMKPVSQLDDVSTDPVAETNTADIPELKDMTLAEYMRATNTVVPYLRGTEGFDTIYVDPKDPMMTWLGDFLAKYLLEPDKNQQTTPPENRANGGFVLNKSLKLYERVLDAERYIQSREGIQTGCGVAGITGLSGAFAGMLNNNNSLAMLGTQVLGLSIIAYFAVDDKSSQ